MTRYIVRRVFSFVPVLLAVTVFTFVLVRVIPGGPFDRVGDKTLPPEVVANLEAMYHLDLPVWQQYLEYLWNLAHLDLGPSFSFRTLTVNDIVRESLRDCLFHHRFQSPAQPCLRRPRAKDSTPARTCPTAPHETGPERECCRRGFHCPW